MSETKQPDRAAGAVVIGAGAMGLLTAKTLVAAGVSPVTLVQGHAYSEDNILMPHFLCRPEKYAADVAKPAGKRTSMATLDELSIPGVQSVVGVATAIEDNGVLVIDGGAGKGGRINFGALVIATGVKYPAIVATPGTNLEARKAFVQGFPALVGKARNILIGGGGPVACEMAGELRRLNAAATITMVFGQDRPMAAWDGTASAKIQERFKALNVKLVPNKRMASTAPSYEAGKHATTTGDEFQADLYLPYFGIPNTEFVEASIPGSTTERGWMKASPFGESTARKGVFAIAVTDRRVAKVMPVLQGEVKVVAANVAAMLKGRPMVKQMETKGFANVGAPIMIQMPLGEYSIYNGSVEGAPLPAWCAQCCGCCNPFCFCCCCCGWCCQYPAGSGIQACCLEKIYMSQGAIAKESHAARPPKMAEMTRD